VGEWHFSPLPELMNETKDAVSISENGFLVGDVDSSGIMAAFVLCP